MKTTRIATLVPGRVCGKLETNPRRSASGKILLLRQHQLGELSDSPGGLILLEAAPLSHPIIQWLGRGIPMALIDAAHAAQWEQGEPVLLDSARAELRAWDEKAAPEPWHAPPACEPGRPVRAADGTQVRLSASVAGASGARRAIAKGAASIGLVRSEYLFPEGASKPTTGFYRRAFSELLTLAEPLTVSIRMLDLASDKLPAWLSRDYSSDVLCNLHGSQLYSHRTVREVADAQICALKDIGHAERLRLIWPSGGSLEDFKRWRDDARSLLPSTVSLGAMLESPIEIMSADRWGSEADFIAFGCNDLLQNLCAADRDAPQLRILLDPYRPELYRFLGEGAQRAGAKLARIHLCGLLPQVEGVLPILIGLGYRHFSGEPTLIPLLAQWVIDSKLDECKTLAAGACAAGNSREVRELLELPSGLPWGLVTESLRR